MGLKFDSSSWNFVHTSGVESIPSMAMITEVIAEPVYYQQPTYAEPVYYQQPAATYYQQMPSVAVGTGTLMDRTPFVFTADAEEIKKIEEENKKSDDLAAAKKVDEEQKATKVATKKKMGCC